MTAPTVPSITAMPDETRNALRADLEEAATHRQHQLDLLGTGGPEAGADTDPVLTAQRLTLRELLTQIHAALARIDDNTFGQCGRCHAAIPVARLEIRPWTTTCVSCAAS